MTVRTLRVSGISTVGDDAGTARPCAVEWLLSDEPDAAAWSLVVTWLDRRERVAVVGSGPDGAAVVRRLLGSAAGGGVGGLDAAVGEAEHVVDLRLERQPDGDR